VDYIRPLARKLVTSSTRAAVRSEKAARPETSAYVCVCVCRDENSVDIIFQRDTRLPWSRSRIPGCVIARTHAFPRICVLCVRACISNASGLCEACTKSTQSFGGTCTYTSARCVCTRSRTHAVPCTHARTHSLLIGTHRERVVPARETHGALRHNVVKKKKREFWKCRHLHLFILFIVHPNAKIIAIIFLHY